MLFKILQDSGLDNNFIRTFEDIYKNSISRVKIRDTDPLKHLQVKTMFYLAYCVQNLYPTILTTLDEKCSKIEVEIGKDCLYNLLFSDYHVPV